MERKVPYSFQRIFSVCFRENDEIGALFCHVCGNRVLLEHHIFVYHFFDVLIKSLHNVLSYHKTINA